MRLNPKLLFGCLLLAALCQPALAKLNVLATTPDLASIAKAVGGDLIDLTVLAKPTEDPHFVDAKPSLILKLNRADVVIEGGAELEIGWLPRLLDEARNTKLAAGAADEGLPVVAALEAVVVAQADHLVVAGVQGIQGHAQIVRVRTCAGFTRRAHSPGCRGARPAFRIKRCKTN